MLLEIALFASAIGLTAAQSSYSFTNTSLTGVKLAACHTSASIESLCLFDGGNDSTYTFYFNTTAHTPDPGALHTGFVTWTLEAEVVGFNEPLTLLYNTASNLAFPMIWPSLDNVQQFAFTTEEHLAVPAYVNDAIEPPAPYRGRGMFWDNRWVVCHSYW
ncbi:hypothetical protein AB5N19_03432 [Seiridium cardinale]